MNEVDWLNRHGILCEDVPRIVGHFSFETPVRFYKKCLSLHCNYGAYSYLAPRTQANFATIGRYTSIGADVLLGPSEHDPSAFTTSTFMNRNVFKLPGGRPDKPASAEHTPLVIGNDVWIGSSACVMGGVTVGDGAVIGYGSVVTKDVPPYAIVAGVPAKIIRYRFDEQTISDLRDFAWWRLDLVGADRQQPFPDFSDARAALTFLKAGEQDGTLKPISQARKKFARENGQTVCVPFEL